MGARVWGKGMITSKALAAIWLFSFDMHLGFGGDFGHMVHEGGVKQTITKDDMIPHLEATLRSDRKVL